MTEATVQDYEEGLQACSEAAKIWMTVSVFSFHKKIMITALAFLRVRLDKQVN